MLIFPKCDKPIHDNELVEVTDRNGGSIDHLVECPHCEEQFWVADAEETDETP